MLPRGVVQKLMWMKCRDCTRGRGRLGGKPGAICGSAVQTRDEWRAADADLCLESIAGSDEAQLAAGIRRHPPPRHPSMMLVLVVGGVVTSPRGEAMWRLRHGDPGLTSHRPRCEKP